MSISAQLSEKHWREKKKLKEGTFSEIMLFADEGSTCRMHSRLFNYEAMKVDGWMWHAEGTSCRITVAPTTLQ